MSMNAWPSLETMHYDGWILRFSGGYTKRANSIYPLYPSKIDVPMKVSHCEKIYNGKNLHTVFKITPYSTPEGLDYYLNNRDYRIIDPTSVQVLNLIDAPKPTAASLQVNNYADDNWLMNYCNFSHFTPKHFHTMTQMLRNIIPDRFFVTLYSENKAVACGLGVIEGNYIGLFDIIVDSDERGKGYGEQLVTNLLNIGLINGAKTAYLQVVMNNTPAMRLYSKLGFREVYHYWYRVK
jgi:ribosomal protein S18 acetylase RimI-like enzyme